MRLKVKLLPIIGLAGLLISLPALPAAAATPGQGLEISPLLIERDVKKGQVITLDIRLRDITSTSLVTTGSVSDFTAQGEGGQPKLLADSAEPNPYSIKPWVQSISSVTLVPQEAKIVHVNITVPANAAPGGYFGIVRFTVAPVGLHGTGVSLSASLGTLVFLKVPGKAVAKASIDQIGAEQNGRQHSLFENGPLTIFERVKNEGNIFIKPTGTIRITNTFGKETAVLSVNTSGGRILPQTSRRFEQLLNKKHLFGRYKAEATMQYEGKTALRSTTFWVVPYKLIAILLGILILLGLGLFKVAKRYNAYIIKRSKK